MIKGLDLSHYNNVNSFHDIVNAGYEFCIIKCTQGDRYADSRFKDYYGRAKSVGLSVGAYHYFDVNADYNNQVEFFLSKYKPVAGDILPVLDSETFTNVGGDNIAKLSRSFIVEYWRKTGVKPMLYSDYYDYNTYLKPIMAGILDNSWVARYNHGIGFPDQPGITVEQYTDKLSVEGVAGVVDGDVLTCSTSLYELKVRMSGLWDGR